MSKPTTSSKKKVSKIIKLHVGAGKANPAPPIGPALGQSGVNIMEFCKAFNAETTNYKPGTPIPVVIVVYADRSFTFTKKQPTSSHLIREAAQLSKGSGEPGKAKSVGFVTRDQLLEIAKQKMEDMTAADLEAAVRTLAGSARSAGIEVKG